MILLIDNYDSFTYNLAQFLGQLGAELEVRRNDQITLEEIGGRIGSRGTAKQGANRQARKADAAVKKIERIVISPGPGVPESAGVCVEVIRRFAGQVPILGVCLGHQAIGQAFGGRIVRAPAIMHGKTSRIHHDKKTIFRKLPQDFVATRYHSLIVERKGLPPEFEISAETSDGIIMGLRYAKLRLEGVQFHPESVLTEVGMQLLSNFMSL